MTRVRSFRELRVYREGFRLAMEVFRHTSRFPDEERYGITSQARRSSRSVCANVAEAWRRRRYPAAFVAKLIDAESEATETRVHLELASACGYLAVEVGRRLDGSYDRLLRQLARMRSQPERWTPAGDRPGRVHRTPSAATGRSKGASTPPSGGAVEGRGRRTCGAASDVRSGRGAGAGEPRKPDGRRQLPSSSERSSDVGRDEARSSQP